jgi:hypothetical protein
MTDIHSSLPTMSSLSYKKLCFTILFLLTTTNMYVTFYYLRNRDIFCLFHKCFIAKHENKRKYGMGQEGRKEYLCFKKC